VTVLERSSAVGGLSRTLERDGIKFDIGPHRFSPQMPEVVERVRELMGGDLMERENLHAVYFDGKLYQYPPRLADFVNVSALVRTLHFGGGWLLARVLDSLDWLRGQRVHRSFEQELLRDFGRPFCRTVAFPMISKVWGTRDLHPEFARIRFQLPTVGRILKKVFIRSSGFNERVFYYPRHGFGTIWERLAAHLEDCGQRIELGAAVERVEARSLEGPFTIRYAQGQTERTLEADVLVSTISNRALLGYLEPTGLVGPVLPDMGHFTSRTLRLGVFLVRGAHLPTRVVIFPEDKYIFNRMSEMNQFADLGYPPDTSVLLVDVICEAGSEFSLMGDREFEARLLEAVLTLGWFGREQVARHFSLRVPEAYPVLSRERYEAQERVFRFFAGTGVILCGREASSDYNNAHNAVAKSFLAARFIAGDVGPREFEDTSKIIGRLPIQD
jgi:protoporphyrinogen oxidase